MGGYAWITLATNDPYCLGALVLAHSLKRVGTKHDLAILITPGVTCTMREKLNAVFSIVEEVNVLDSCDEANLALLARPELGITFTKLHCWKLTQYEKCVFVDADALVVRNCDELFERDELSAAPDVGWPDCFNSGVFVFKPSQTTFQSLISFAASKGSFDGGDQGLLNQYFNDWAYKDITKHLPFIYNMCSTASYSYLPAYKQFGKDVKIIHFIGSTKPWLQYFDSQTGQVHPSSESDHLQELLQHWWNIFCQTVHPLLSPDMPSHDDQDTNIYKARSTLVPIWHDSYPRVSTMATTLSNHLFNIPTDVTHDKTDVPDFSEFCDPWKYYNLEAIECGKNHESKENINDKNSVKYGETQYQPNDNTFYRPLYINNSRNEKTNHNAHCDDTVSCSIEDDVGHLDSIHVYLATVDNDELTESNNGMNYLDEYSKLHTHSDHDKSLSEIRKKNQDAYITCRHIQFENFSKDTHYIQSDSDCRDMKRGEISIKNVDSKDCRNDMVRADIPTISSQTHFQTCCTEPKSITCQSKTNSSNDVVHDNSGIAGALAQMTLGVARSPEQEVLEQHMRKQSWEQGKIDYMGRDSFDNIWTKICATISNVTEHESTFPYEKIEATQSANVESQASSTVAEIPTLPQSRVAIACTSTDENVSEDTVTLNIAFCDDPRSSAVISDKYKHLKLTNVTNAIAQNSGDVIQKCPGPLPISSCSTSEYYSHESREMESIHRNLETMLPTDVLQVQEKRCVNVITSSLAPGIKFESTVPDACQANLDYTTESLTTHGLEQTKGNEVNAVSIQVAESVLEADIKESVTEDLNPVIEEAISSISAQILESISTVVETPLEPRVPARSQPVVTSLPMQSNGTTVPIRPNESSQLSRSQTSVLVQRDALQTQMSPCIPTLLSSSSLSSSSSLPPSKTPSSGLVNKKEHEAYTQITNIEENASTVGIAPEIVDQTTVCEPLSARKIMHSPNVSVPTDPTAPTGDFFVPDIGSNISETKSLAVKYDKEQHVELSTAMKSKPSSTPIISERTTQSPFVHDTANVEETNKVTKRIVKKPTRNSSTGKHIGGNEANQGEKARKTINKKASTSQMREEKESEEELNSGTSSSTVSKQKKVIKVKKTTKLVQDLDTITCIPDTPLPTTSETPKPPKRKLKSAISKSSTSNCEPQI